MSAGGEITGKPGICGVDDVVTDVVSVAVVEAPAGTVMGERRTSSDPFTELGGLAVLSSDLREERIDAERRLSLDGLDVGGGILMFGLSIVVVVWDDCAWLDFLLVASALLVAMSRECDKERPVVFKGKGPSLLEVEEAVMTGLRELCSAMGLSISFSVPLVEVRDKGGMLLSHVLLPRSSSNSPGSTSMCRHAAGTARRIFH